MKTFRDKNKEAETISKYLSGEIGEVEASEFKAAISIPPDTRKAWRKLHDRLQDEKLIPAQPITGKSWLIQPVIKIAAAILILLGIGAVVFLTMSRKPSVELVQLNTANATNTLIKTLADGSVIYIAGNSSFYFPEKFKSDSRNVELKGEAFFDIAPDPGKPFIIETETALIQVMGTAFNVKTRNSHAFELYVNRGKVKVTLKTDPLNSQMVMAGEMISAIKNSLVKSDYIASEANSWYKQHMHFKDESLQQIIHVLNRNFNTNFVLADRETGKHRLTVTFHDETPETMTELICMTLGLTSQKIDGKVVFFEHKKGKEQR